MKINFEKIHIHGFLSFGDSTIQLSDNGFVLVRGINENPNDNTSSNGSGKSTILEAVAYALTGETIRGTKSVVNINTDDGCFVELWFNCDGRDYYLLRSKDSKEYKTNLKIIIDGKDMSGKGIRDSEKLLQQYLPELTSQLLGSVIILGQGLPQRFSDNTPSGRKEILEKLSKSDFMIDDLKNRIAYRKSILSDQIRKSEDTIISLRSQKSVYEKQIEDFDRKFAEIPDISKYNEALSQLDESLAKANEYISNLTSQINEYTTHQNSILSEYTENVNLQNQVLAQITEKFQPQLDAETIVSNDINSKMYALRQEIRRLESVRDVCPTCGQKLPNVVRMSTVEQNKQLMELDQLLQESKKRQLDLTEQMKTEQVQASLQIKQNLNTLTEKLNASKSQISVGTNTLQSANLKLSEYVKRRASIQNEVDQYDANKKHLKEQIEKCTVLVQECTQKIQSESATLDDLQKHVRVIEKFNTVISRDFRGYLLGSVIDYINAKAKAYAMEVFGTDKINFALDGNNIEISYDNKSMESLSGGERQKVDLIVQFSIRDMLCKFLGFSSNILCLDEIFDALDFAGCQKMIDLISHKLSDINSVYIISHRDDLQVPADKEILVVKNKFGVSEIKK